MAHSAWLLDQFPSAPCGGFHLQENWNWQDPVFSAIYLKPCTHLDTLWFPRTVWRITLCLLIRGMYSFQSFVFDSVWFPSAAQYLCDGFYAFTSRVLDTLRQHIWCSHFLCNVCTWKPHSGMKQCVFSLGTEYIVATTRKDILTAKTNPMFWLPRQQDPADLLLTFEDLWKRGVSFFILIVPTFMGAQNGLAFPVAWLFLSRP